MAVVSKTSVDRGWVGEGKCAPAAFAFVEERYLAVSEELRVLDRLHDEKDNLLHVGVSLDRIRWAEGHGVLEKDAGVAESLVAIPEEGDVDEKVGKLDLPVLLVSGLNGLHGHVGVLLLVVEGEE